MGREIELHEMEEEEEEEVTEEMENDNLPTHENITIDAHLEEGSTDGYTQCSSVSPSTDGVQLESDFSSNESEGESEDEYIKQYDGVK